MDFFLYLEKKYLHCIMATKSAKKKIKRIPVPQKPPKVEPAKKAYSRSKEKNILRKDRNIK